MIVLAMCAGGAATEADLAGAAGGQHGDRGHEAAHAVAALVQHVWRPGSAARR